jgi:predicted amidohydrolase
MSMPLTRRTFIRKGSQMSAAATLSALGAQVTSAASATASAPSPHPGPGKEKIRIGSWQGPIVEGDLAKNTAKVKEVIDETRALKLDFLCFPECYLSGYRPESVKKCAVPADDPAIADLLRFTANDDTVILVGFAERKEGRIFNTALVAYKGQVLGLPHKTMLVPVYDTAIFATDLDLPVMEAKNIKFGVAICHTTSFVEPSLYLRWRGARLLFTPHYNDIPPGGITESGDHHTFWEHRTMVLNNQAALAALLKMVVVRSNIVMVTEEHLGAGDSNIWDMNGVCVAAGQPFTEALVTAEFDKEIFLKEHWISRKEIPVQLLDMIAQAAKEYPR